MLKNLITAKKICTLYNLGFKSKMPGTLGSLVAVIFGVFILYFFSLKVLFFLYFLILIIAFYSVFVYQKKVGKNDKSEIIIDEFVGQLIPMLFINLKITEIILAFLLFRFFDIFKIFPANIIDKNYSNYIGVILDDLIAGIQASFVIYILYFLL